MRWPARSSRNSTPANRRTDPAPFASGARAAVPAKRRTRLRWHCARRCPAATGTVRAMATGTRKPRSHRGPAWCCGCGKTRSPRAWQYARWSGGGALDSWKARKTGGSSAPRTKNLRKIRGFGLFFPLHPHALPLSLITFNAWARWSARLRSVRWQSWRAALRGESKEKYGECENDPDATGTVARGDLRSQQQGGPRDAGQTGNHRGRGSEEEWRVRATRHRPTGTRGPQSSHGAQPGDWRGHQDRGQEGREVPRGQERERCDCSAKEGEVVESTAQCL